MPVRKQEEVVIKPLKIERVQVPIVGVTELVVHKWSEKAIRMMEERQQKTVRGKKEAKDPDADYAASLYYLADGRYGFPSAGFKSSIVTAARLFEGVVMVTLKQCVFVNGEWDAEHLVQLVPIIGEPRKRRDMVRLETGVADVRYRYGFPEWSASLDIEVNTNVISLEMLYNLVDAAGYGGVGENRPSAPKSYNGNLGRFRVAG